MANEYRRLGLDESRLRVSDYGFATLERAVRPAAVGPLRIGYVGTLVWHKGVHVLIDAVRSLAGNSYELLIFGDPNVFPEYTADLRRRASGLPYDSWVSSIEPLPRPSTPISMCCRAVAVARELAAGHS